MEIEEIKERELEKFLRITCRYNALDDLRGETDRAEACFLAGWDAAMKMIKEMLKQVAQEDETKKEVMNLDHIKVDKWPYMLPRGSLIIDKLKTDEEKAQEYISERLKDETN